MTSTVPTADRLVTLLPKTMTLSQMDRACFTVLATLQESREVSGAGGASANPPLCRGPTY